MKTTAQPNHETPAAAQQGNASSNPFQLLQNKAPIGNPFQLLAEEEMLQPKFNPLQFAGATLSANSHPVVQRLVDDGLKRGTKVYDEDGNKYKIRKQTEDKTQYKVRRKGKKGKKEIFRKEALFMKKPAKATADSSSDTDDSSDSDSPKRRRKSKTRRSRSRSPKKKKKSRSRTRSRSRSRERAKKYESKQQQQTKENNKAALPAAAAAGATATEVMRAPAAAASTAVVPKTTTTATTAAAGALPAKAAVRRMQGPAALPPGYKPEQDQPKAAAAIPDSVKAAKAIYPSINISLTNKRAIETIEGLKKGSVKLVKGAHQDGADRHFTAGGCHFYLQAGSGDQWIVTRITSDKGVQLE
jgi:hypothetical protein